MTETTVVKPRFYAGKRPNMGGTGLIGYITLGYAEMVKVFGKPDEEGSDSYKVSTSWVIKDRKTGSVCEVYDYKATSLYSASMPSVKKFRSQLIYDWHMGGTCDIDALAAFISEKLGRPIVGRCG